MRPAGVNSSKGKARCRRGGMRKFCRRVGLIKRSSPSSSNSHFVAGSTRSSAAWLRRIVAKKSADGKKPLNWSLG